VFWTAIAVGVLLKGPLIAMVVGLAAVALIAIDRSARWLWGLKPLPGVVWFACLVLPWFIAIIGRAGEAFFAESVGQDLLSKIVTGQESHGAPPGYYFILFWLTFWPGATLAAIATPAVWAARRAPATKFLLAWLVPSWIVLELVVTKLPHYVLPLYPAVAILIAGAVDARVLSRKPVLVWGDDLVVRRFRWSPASQGIVALAVIGRQFGLLVWPLFGFAAFMSFLAWRLYEADGAEHALLRAVAGATLNRDRDLRAGHSLARAIVPEPGARAHSARQRLPAAGGRGGRLSGAEPGIPRRHGDPSHRYRRRRPNSCAAESAVSLSSRPARSGALRSAPKPSGCATPPAPASTRSTSAPDSRSPLRSTARQVRRERERRAQAGGGRLRRDAAAMGRAPTSRNIFRCSAASPDRLELRRGVRRVVSASAPSWRSSSSPPR